MARASDNRGFSDSLIWIGGYHTEKGRCPTKKDKRFVRAFFVAGMVGLVVLPVARIAAEQEPVTKAVFAMKFADDPNPMPMYAAFWN